MWLHRKSRDLVDAFEEAFEDTCAHAVFPEDGALDDDHRRQAIEIMFGALQHISSLFIAHEVVTSRGYGRDEVFVIMTHFLDT